LLLQCTENFFLHLVFLRSFCEEGGVFAPPSVMHYIST